MRLAWWLLFKGLLFNVGKDEKKRRGDKKVFVCVHREALVIFRALFIHLKKKRVYDTKKRFRLRNVIERGGAAVTLLQIFRFGGAFFCLPFLLAPPLCTASVGLVFPSLLRIRGFFQNGNPCGWTWKKRGRYCYERFNILPNVRFLWLLRKDK